MWGLKPGAQNTEQQYIFTDRSLRQGCKNILEPRYNAKRQESEMKQVIF
jgi:hypothetical protein